MWWSFFVRQSRGKRWLQPAHLSVIKCKQYIWLSFQVKCPKTAAMQSSFDKLHLTNQSRCGILALLQLKKGEKTGGFCEVLKLHEKNFDFKVIDSALQNFSEVLMISNWTSNIHSIILISYIFLQVKKNSLLCGSTNADVCFSTWHDSFILFDNVNENFLCNETQQEKGTSNWWYLVIKWQTLSLDSS